MSIPRGRYQRTSKPWRHYHSPRRASVRGAWCLVLRIALFATLLTGALLSCKPAPAFAPPAPPQAPYALATLRDVICELETRGTPDRDAAISRAGARGYCQIMPATARLRLPRLGYAGLPSGLHDRTLSMTLALGWLEECERALIRVTGRVTIRALARCYLIGDAAHRLPRSRVYRRYILEVESTFAVEQARRVLLAEVHTFIWARRYA